MIYNLAIKHLTMNVQHYFIYKLIVEIIEIQISAQVLSWTLIPYYVVMVLDFHLTFL